MQTRWQSVAETLTGLGVGYLVANVTQRIVFPMYDIELPGSAHHEITLIFTVVAAVRGVSVRRFFNWFHGKAAK